MATTLDLKTICDPKFPVVLVWESPTPHKSKIEELSPDGLMQSLFARLGAKLKNKHVAFNFDKDKWILVKEMEPSIFKFTEEINVSDLPEHNKSQEVVAKIYLASVSPVGSIQ